MNLRKEIDNAISSVLDSGMFVGGEFVSKFEAEFAAYCGVDYCVGMGNGTDAIFIALKALNVGPGDEVITAANTFTATAEAIIATGAKVVFVDCKDDYTIDADKILITPRTKAIVPVHMYGQPCDMEKIMNFGVFVVEDCSHAHGATIDGQKVGSFGDIGAFSFYPTKLLGAYGQAGAIVTDSFQYANRCRAFGNHGSIRKNRHFFPAYNSGLDAIQAAILSVKLEYLDKWNAEAIATAIEYNRQLKDCIYVLPEITPGRVFHQYVIRTPDRDALAEKLGLLIHYPKALPNLGIPEYRSDICFPKATWFQDQIVSIPLFLETGLCSQ